MINKTLSDELLSFFLRYLAFYSEFLQLETDKYDDMAHNIISSLDERVKVEEAYMLKSKGLEIERDKLIAQTELPKATFLQLIPLFDESVRDQIQEVYEELSRVLLDLKQTNLRCNQLTQLRLHRVEVDLQKIAKNPDLQKRYDAQARKSHVYKSILSKKI